ncbi:MAG TPA: MFS transporter [Acidimicrobiales bacterium]|nr:MFS transporter [Acidimicrobiales bacterium]
MPVTDRLPHSGAGRELTVGDVLDETPTGRVHRRAALVSGVGFFTDAYDLFVISTVAVLVTKQWHLGTTQASWVAGSAILGAFVGAMVFGRWADRVGRKPIYGLVAALMIVGALASALAPSYAWLVGSRFVLGLGIGGDYPVSAVLMSEYANRQDRGRLVGMVFSMQAVGLIVGPVVAIALLGSGLGHDATWRTLLALGALPAAAVVWLRTRMPESPRYQAQVKGDSERALAEFSRFADREVHCPAAVASVPVAGAPRRLLLSRRMLGLVVGTAGAWFLFDYAYYGNTLSLPAILSSVDPHASTVGKLALSLLMFVVFAVPGYLMAVWRMDRFGHRRLQSLGFAVMALAFLALGAIGPLTTLVVPFVAIFGLSYFFVEFGPNTTTFVLPAEVFPTRVRTTGHGIAAGVGKLGAFIGVFLVPQFQKDIGLRGMLLVAAAASVAGWLCTRLLPEPGRRSLDSVAGEEAAPPERELVGTAA